MRGILLDEHLTDAIANALHRHDPSIRIRRIGDGIAPPFGSEDPDLLVWIESVDFVLITNNRGSMPIHLGAHMAAGRHVPGIIQVPKQFRISDLAEELALILGASMPGELVDRITYIRIPQKP